MNNKTQPERIEKMVFWAIFGAGGTVGLLLSAGGDSVAWWGAIGGAIFGLFIGWLETEK